MEEQEVPTEHLTEEINHEATHSHIRWISGVALSSALLAVLAAITSLLSGHHSNEAMIDEIQSANQWAYYQAKGVKAAVLQTKVDLLDALGKPVTVEDKDKLTEYRKQQEAIAEKAEERERGAEAHFRRHLVFARGVTLFQISIAISAVSALLRRRRFWFVSLAFGVAGLFFLVQGWLFTA